MALQIPDERTSAANARAEAARKKLSGREIARQLDLTAVYVSRRLSGAVEMSETDLRRFAAVLGTTVAALVGEVDQ